MIERIQGLPAGVDGVRCNGKLTVDRRDEAIAWLAGLPGRPSITHRVLPDAGVVVVEVTEPLRVQDIDELAALVDGWLAEHPTLHGLVLHARAFPGWENLSGLVRHLRFVVGHHRQVDRLGLAVDGSLAAVAARSRGAGRPPAGAPLRLRRVACGHRVGERTVAVPQQRQIPGRAVCVPTHGGVTDSLALAASVCHDATHPASTVPVAAP